MKQQKESQESEEKKINISDIIQWALLIAIIILILYGMKNGLLIKEVCTLDYNILAGNIT